MTEQRKFEAWASKQGMALHYEGDGHYKNGIVAHWWQAWTARADQDRSSEWQPIGTAPKDGTAVLVWNKGCGHWVASYRLPMRGEPQYESHYVREWRDGGGRWATPTLWVPLPPPPKGTE